MSSLSAISSGIESPVNLSLILATVWAVNHGFSNIGAPSMTIAYYSTDNRMHLYQRDFIEVILKETSNRYRMNFNLVMRIISENSTIDYMEFPLDPYSNEEHQQALYRNQAIWILDSLEAFEFLEADVLNYRNGYRRNGQYCIIYTGSEPHSLQIIEIIFRRLIAIYVINVNVFIGQVPEVYTFFPYNKQKCQSTEPEHIASFRSIKPNAQFAINRAFFPAKLNNFYGCEISVSTFYYPPYMLIRKERRTGNLLALQGIEGRLIVLLAKRINFTIHIIESPTHDHGDIFDNGTGTGVFESIFNKRANISIAALARTPQRSAFMLGTKTYIYSPLLVCIPDGNKFSPFERIRKPYKSTVWLHFWLTLAIGFSVIALFKALKNIKITNFVLGYPNRIPFWNMINVLFGNPVHGKLPTRNFARYLLSLWLLYSIVMRTAYSGELFHILQDQKSRTTIESLEELLNQNFTFFGAPLLRDIMRQISSTVIVQRTDLRVNSFATIVPRLHSGKHKIAYPLPEYLIKDYNNQIANLKSPLKTLPRKLIVMQIVIYMTKHSYMEHPLNNMLSNIISSGILVRYEAMYYKSDPIKTKIHPSVLDVTVISGLFIVFFLMSMFAMFVFLLELCSKRFAFIKSFLDSINR